MLIPKIFIPDTPLYNYNETNYLDTDSNTEENIKILIGFIILNLLFS